MSFHNNLYYNRAYSNSLYHAIVSYKDICCWNFFINVKWTLPWYHGLSGTWINNPLRYGSYRGAFTYHEYKIISSKLLIYIFGTFCIFYFGLVAISYKMTWFSTNEASFDTTSLIWKVTLASTWVECWIFTLRLFFFLYGHFMDKSCYHIVHYKFFQFDGFQYYNEVVVGLEKTHHLGYDNITLFLRLVNNF